MTARIRTLLRGAGARLAAAALAATLVATGAGPAQALRVVTWNLFAYPDYNLAARQPNLRTVMANINADVLIAQELNSAAGYDSLLDNVLNVVEPGQWAGSGFYTLQPFPVEGGAIFYKPAKVGIAFTNVVSTSGPRDVLFTRVTPVGYTALAGTFRVYSIHLKAGNPSTSPSDSTTRRLECTDIRNTLNLAPANTNLLLGGDSNFYGATEGGYIRLTESQADNDGRLKDPLTLPGNWHLVPSYNAYYTQCPCNTSCGSFSGGGLDDRFDLFLSSYNLQDGQGVDLALAGGGYYAYGNDGNHYNDDVNGGGFNTAVGLTIATALKNASDHLPVVCTVQLAAKIAAASQLDFGSAILGGAPQQTLSVSNPATPPADALDYSLAPPAGFTAPGGSFAAAAGAAANDHALGMSTGSVGAKSGTLTVNSDAPDSLAKSVKLSGRVLAHAVPSLDSLTSVVEDSLDLGVHAAADFRDSTLRVHDLGYNSLEARLSVNAGAITGGAGRFSIVGGFQAAVLADVGKSYGVRFDPVGATLDSLYEATLTFSTADEPLPGATPRPDLVVHLAAMVHENVAVEPGAGRLALRLYPARPNPFADGTRFALDLPEAAPVRLAIFDLSGRKVAGVVDGSAGPGHHEWIWSARDDRGGRVPAGLYFARLRTPGIARTLRLVVLP